MQPIPEHTDIPNLLWSMTPVKGKAILVSGHDLGDLEELLKQTEGKISTSIRTVRCFPAMLILNLRNTLSLATTAEHGRINEGFDEFPGAILMTTNCIQKPRESYMARIFTCGLVQWPGAVHVENRDFAPVIKAALDPGFTEDAPEEDHDKGLPAIQSFAAGKVCGTCQCRKDPPLLPCRRMRRCKVRTQLLHGVCREGT